VQLKFLGISEGMEEVLEGIFFAGSDPHGKVRF
jgi:hypothetical protein